MRSLFSVLGWTIGLALTSRSAAQTIHFEVHGSAAGDFFGHSVAGPGDVDGDSVPDVAVGAPQHHPAFLGHGYVRLLSGADGATLLQLPGAAPGDRFGWAVAGVGDVDLDLVPDFLVGAPGADNAGAGAGRALVLSGLDGSPIFVLDGTASGDAFGTAVSGAGDANVDGWPDFLIGAPQGGASPGFARLFSGRDGSFLREWQGLGAGDNFGSALAAAGRVDGDMVVDVIIGAPRDDSAWPNGGSATVFSGIDGSVVHRFEGREAGAELGNDVAGAGDVDGDGRDDLIVAAWHETLGIPGAGNTRGVVRVHRGSDGAQLFEQPGITGDDMMGLSVASAGDVDGDGAHDFMFAARHDNEELHTGAVYVHSGSDGRLHQNYFGEIEPDDLGKGMAAVGDLNADGLWDIVLGSSENDHHTPREGYVRAYLGCPGGVVNFAPGCAGSGGFTPRLRLSGCPGGDLTLSLDRGLGGAQMRLYVGGEEQDERQTSACFVLAPAHPVQSFVLSGSQPGEGTASIPWQLPDELTPGSSLWIQATVDDPAGPAGRASSNAIAIAIP